VDSRPRGALAIGAYIIKMRRRRFEVPVLAAVAARASSSATPTRCGSSCSACLSLLLILLHPRRHPVRALDPTLGANRAPRAAS
jgi:hypothetical protein